MPDSTTDVSGNPAAGAYPYEIKTVERGEQNLGKNEGWHNHFIVKMNTQTGDTWILTHIIEKQQNFLKWVFVPTQE